MHLVYCIYICNYVLLRTMDTQNIQPRHLRSRIKQRNLLQSDIATAIGCDQGQVSRLLAGKSSSNSKTYRHICEHVFANEKPYEHLGKKILDEAVNQLWDGTIEHARVVAKLLQVLSQFPTTKREMK